MPLLALNQVSKYFGGVKAAKEVSFIVEEGSVHGLIGPNGSGKTTIFNCLTGIYPLTHGSVIFQDERLDGKPPHKIAAKGVARTFQNLRLFAGLTVLENILVGRHIHQQTGLWGAILQRKSAKLEQRETEARASELAALCGLKGRENILAKELPYGQRRRLEIARSLALEPKLLMLDEPAAGMNPKEAGDLKELILSIRAMGITILLIEHNVRLVMGLCDRVSVMESGSLIADDVPENIVKNPKVIEAYLGKDDG